MCHVLIIEDECMISMHVADIARDAGATSVDIAETQQEAVDFARENLPAIILSDVRLREGTGPNAVAAIAAEHGVLPVIFITATPGACVPCHPSAVILQKPVSSLRLTAHFRQLARV